MIIFNEQIASVAETMQGVVASYVDVKEAIEIVSTREFVSFIRLRILNNKRRKINLMIKKCTDDNLLGAIDRLIKYHQLHSVITSIKVIGIR